MEATPKTAAILMNLMTSKSVVVTVRESVG
jgi:hypothetical protein